LHVGAKIFNKFIYLLPYNEIVINCVTLIHFLGNYKDSGMTDMSMDSDSYEDSETIETLNNLKFMMR